MYSLAIGEGQIVVIRLDLSANRAEKRFGIAGGAHNERGSGRVGLPNGEIRDGLGIFPDLANDRGPHNTYNLEQVWFLHDREALSKRFLARPHHLGHGLIDDGHARGIFAVEIGEVAAAQERDAHSFKMAGSHVVKIDERAAVIGVGLFSFAKDGGYDAAS